jgi:hypothetical protein
MDDSLIIPDIGVKIIVMIGTPNPQIQILDPAGKGDFKRLFFSIGIGGRRVNIYPVITVPYEIAQDTEDLIVLPLAVKPKQSLGPGGYGIEFWIPFACKLTWHHRPGIIMGNGPSPNEPFMGGAPVEGFNDKRFGIDGKFIGKAGDSHRKYQKKKANNFETALFHPITPFPNLLSLSARPGFNESTSYRQ